MHGQHTEAESIPEWGEGRGEEEGKKPSEAWFPSYSLLTIEDAQSAHLQLQCSVLHI